MTPATRAGKALLDEWSAAMADPGIDFRWRDRVDGIAAIEAEARQQEREALAPLLREAIEIVHQTDSIRDHANPNDKTGWILGPIETCADPLCVEVLSILRGES